MDIICLPEERQFQCQEEKKKMRAQQTLVYLIFFQV